MSLVEKALENLPSPVVLFDPSTCLAVWANTAAQSHFNLSQRQLVTRSATELFPMLPTIASVGRDVATTQADTLYRAQESNGVTCDIEVFGSDATFGIVLSEVRMTTSRQGRGRVVQSMGQMIGHEIKNPLAGIRGAAQLLHDDVRSDDSRELANVIIAEIDRIKRLAESLQDFGDVESGTIERINVHALMRRARQVVQVQSDTVAISEHYDPSLPEVDVFADGMMQVLINLMKNATEAMGADGGDIILSTRSRAGTRKGTVKLPVEIRVEDTGPGIPPDIIDTMFEPFWTTKPSGQGLGLALVTSVVETHGGLVEVESRPGRTRFSILLPAGADA